MHPFKLGPYGVPMFLRPEDPFGALIYLVLVVSAALLLSRGLRVAMRAALAKQGHIDRTTVSFLQQMGSALIWVMAIILYAHLIPVLRAVGTAMLAGAGVASVVIGLAAQSTLGNLVAGVSITIYKPFRLGDTLQVSAPGGTEVGTVESISLGYTRLSVPDGRFVVLPNSLAASQATINLSETFARWPVSIVIGVSRDADLEALRKLALGTATEVAGEKAVKGCFLTKIDATEAQLELRVRAPDAATRDSLRTTLLMRLAQRFAEAPAGVKPASPPTFA